MTTTKIIDNNRRTHAIKILAEASRKNQAQQNDESPNADKEVAGQQDLFHQYQIIREDVLKLREDLAVGYDLLKNWMSDNMTLKNMLRVYRRVNVTSD